MKWGRLKREVIVNRYSSVPGVKEWVKELTEKVRASACLVVDYQQLTCTLNGQSSQDKS